MKFTKNKKRKSALALLSVCALSTVLAVQPTLGAFAQTFHSGISSDGKYYTDYDSPEEAKSAAEELGAEIANEGTVLLKNDGSLPVSLKERVSVFGGSQDNILVTAGATTQQSGDRIVTDALKAHGFQVNPTLDSFYKSQGNTIGMETTEFDRVTQQSFGLYSDLALITFTRTSGEGNDASRNTNEEDKGWEHEAPATKDGKAQKHYLQLTDQEQALIKFVKEQGFKKIVIVLNSSLRLEMSDLEKDEAINGIIWMGMPGENGIHALPKILDGTVNPSGKTVDIWYKDFTADPTWYNFGDNSQVGSNYQYLKEDGTNADIYGIDYEEDIYIGYRYYETRAFEASKTGSTDTFSYDDAVVYPFGFGLSYTSFEYNDIKVVMDNKSEMTGNLSHELFESSKGHTANVKSATATVTVKNTGTAAGKEVVQLYVSAPYTGKVEKSHVSLIGFAKTDILQPGQSQKLKIEFNVQDMASYDAEVAKSYVLEGGDYTVMAMSSSHGWADKTAKDYKEVTFNLDQDTNLKLDDFTDNEVGNLFSEENGMFNSLRTNDTEGYEVNKDKTAKTTLMTRANGLAVLPEAPTTADLTLANAYVESNSYWNTFRLSNGVDDDSTNLADYPWLKDVNEAFAEGGRAKDWDQTGEYGYKVSDMSGINPDDTENVITEGKFKDLTGQQAWDRFISSLAFSDLIAIVGNKDGSVNAEAFDWHPSAGSDSTTNLSRTHQWPSQPVIASTWNVDLANREGIIVANMAMMKGVWEWWGPGMQVHRSPFAGRTHEYYAEDGYLAGKIAASLVAGVSSRGLGISIKHFGFNDQETGRTSNGGTSAWVSEQAIREYYLKPFQMALQEGGATNLMTAYGRVGRVMGMGNYNLITGLVRKEWGYSGSISSDNYSLVGNFMPNDLEIRGGLNGSCTDTPSGEWDAENKTVKVPYTVYENTVEFNATTAYAVGAKVQRTTGSGKNRVTKYYEFTAAHEAGEWNDEHVKEIDRPVEKSGTIESDAQWYLLRQATIRSLYIIANTTRNYNALDWSAFDFSEVKLTDAEAGKAYNFDLSIDTEVLGTDVVKYSATGLPAGLTINQTTGVISGAATEAGTFEVTLTVNADGWLERSAKLALKVAPNLTVEAGSAISEEITVWQMGDTVKMPTQYGQQGCTIDKLESNISLPAGLSIKDGVVSGKLTEPGMYSVVVEQTAHGMFMGFIEGNATNKQVIVIEVTASETPVEPEVPEIKIIAVEEIEGGYKITFSDESSIELKNGTNGTNGVDGTTPTVEISEDGFWVINGTKTEVKAAGTDGAPGAQGQQGPKGDKGDKGDVGEKGETGEAGSGCNGSVASTAIACAAALTLVGAAVIVRKKHENK